jgi:hypothetical protein
MPKAKQILKHFWLMDWHKKVNKPLIGTTSVSIWGACSRNSKDMVPWPLQDQSNMSKSSDLQIASHQYL